MGRIILIVDDSAQTASTLEIALGAIPGVEVASAGCGEEALEYLSGPGGSRVAALVTDLRMPGMDGFDLIRRLKSEPSLARLPVLVISGDTDPRVPARLRELGADGYYGKPFSPAEVRNRLEQLIDATQSA
jgi:CheY-like chemotaxis protein